MVRGIRILLLVLFVFLPAILFAQSFSGGVKLGFDISQVDGDQRGGYSAIFPTGCLYAKKFFGEDQRASLAIGVSYVRKGCKEVKKDELGDITSIYALRLQYIEVPLIFSWKLNKFKIPRLVDYTFKNKLSLDAGISYAHLMKAEVNHGQGFIEPDRAFFNYDCGLHLGLTYFIGEHFFLNYRFSYTFFFLPIRKHPGGQVYRLN